MALKGTCANSGNVARVNQYGRRTIVRALFIDFFKKILYNIYRNKGKGDFL